MWLSGGVQALSARGGSRRVSVSVISGVGVIDEVRLYRGSKILEIAGRLRGHGLPREFTPEMAVDVFYSFYLPVPQLDEEAAARAAGEGDALRVMAVAGLLRSNALWRVKPYTVADSMTSVVAAASFIERLASSLLTTRQVSGGAGGGGEDGAPSGESGSGEDRVDQSVASAVERALERIEQEVRTAKEIKQMIAGMGVGRSSVLEFDDSAEEIIRLARETDVERILRSLRGMKFRLSRSRLERRHSRGWIRGLEFGSDVERIHYSQLALPDEIFYANYGNSKLLLYEKVLEASRGPIYVLLDKSGSMVGSKIDWARAVAVALFKKAVDEGRRFYARFFDSVPYQPIVMRPNAKTREIVRMLSHLARVKAGGGTDIEGAISAAVQDITSSPRGDERISDIILITDGEDRINVENVRGMLDEVDARLHSVVIQGHNPHLQKASYRYMTVKKLSEREALSVVEFA